jgi:hypothetical protein
MMIIARIRIRQLCHETFNGDIFYSHAKVKLSSKPFLDLITGTSTITLVSTIINLITYSTNSVIGFKNICNKLFKTLTSKREILSESP